MLKNSFNYMISLHSRPATLSRPSTALTVNLRITPSSYFRNIEAKGNIVSIGREFIISVGWLSAYGEIRRGDIINDVDYKESTVSEIFEMHDLGGDIMGYRVRCQ